MLLFLALLVVASAAGIPSCPNNAVMLDIGVKPAVYRCIDNPGQGPTKRVVEAPATRVLSKVQRGSVGPAQSPIDTLQGWNGLQLISPIGRSVNGKPYSAQTFLSLVRQNLQTMTFAFRTTSNPPTMLQIQSSIYKWDNVTNSPVGSAIWTTAPNSADILSEAVKNWTYISYDVQATSITLAEPPAPPVVVASVPINAALDANTNYVIVFFSPANATFEGTGAIAARQDNPTAYADGVYYWNSETSSTVPTTGWEAANPQNDAAFRLTFSELVDCDGSWVANPYWAAQQNPGSPANCLETTCSDYPQSPQAGFLDEQYTITLQASLNGQWCNASYGTVLIPTSNTLGVLAYRLFSPCTQALPCVNCGPNVTSNCYRTAPDQSGVTCTAQRDVTWPNQAVTSTTSGAYPVVNPPRAETQVPPTPTACPAPSNPSCPCTDCVTVWQNVGDCEPVECGSANGLLNQTAVQDPNSPPPGQDAPIPPNPQLYRACDIQTPPAGAFRRVNCTNATVIPCPVNPTE